MLQWLIHLIIDSLVLLAAAKMMPKVELKGFKSAILVALIIGILSFLLSWILTAIFNIGTLGLFYFLGLGFVIRIIVFAIIIELADKLSTDFKTIGFLNLHLAGNNPGYCWRNCGWDFVLKNQLPE